MSYIDIIILLFLLYGAYRGFSRGLIVEVATLAGLVLGVYMAVRYSSYTENFLRDFLNFSSRYISYVALAVTFILVVILVYIVGKLLTKLVDIISLGLVNKLLGTALGVAKYFLIVCVLLLVTDALNEKFQFISEETRQKSLLFYPFLNFAQEMYNAIRF
ncbi:CvpA family protein [Odoribacter sp. Z80]|uniref:CvpA family protein n=1 Tax=Odoribacter sp. Z80 TaxID=2304575 RepID=UPI00137AA371|nr:CvpA family protein [Odoribacter sp. Z80]